MSSIHQRTTNNKAKNNNKTKNNNKAKNNNKLQIKLLNESVSINNIENISDKIKYLGDNPIITLSDYSIYVIKGSKIINFIKHVSVFAVNNPIDSQHVNKIENGIKTLTTIDNVFNVVEYSNGMIQILDGQHRQNALLYLLDSELITKELVIHLYQSDYCNSPRTMQLFNRFNNLKPFAIQCNVTEAIIDILNGLRKITTFKDGIKQTGRPSARKPYMSDKEFSTYLEPLIKELGPGNYNVENVIKYIIEINNSYKSICNDYSTFDLFKSELATDKKEIMINLGFYLNTEKTKDRWIIDLKNKIINK